MEKRDTVSFLMCARGWFVISKEMWRDVEGKHTQKQIKPKPEQDEKHFKKKIGLWRDVDVALCFAVMMQDC